MTAQVLPSSPVRDARLVKRRARIAPVAAPPPVRRAIVHVFHLNGELIRIGDENLDRHFLSGGASVLLESAGAQRSGQPIHTRDPLIGIPLLQLQPVFDESPNRPV